METKSCLVYSLDNKTVERMTIEEAVESKLPFINMWEVAPNYAGISITGINQEVIITNIFTIKKNCYIIINNDKICLYDDDIFAMLNDYFNSNTFIFFLFDNSEFLKAKSTLSSYCFNRISKLKDTFELSMHNMLVESIDNNIDTIVMERKYGDSLRNFLKERDELLELNKKIIGLDLNNLLLV